MTTQFAQSRILALHGFTGVGADFSPFAEMCDASAWHCPNLPGHGPSPRLDCTPEATVEWIETERKMPQAGPPRPEILLGYSMGARAALQHAVRYADHWKALVLISPNPGIEDETSRAERRTVDEKLAQRIERNGVAPFIEFWQSTPMIRSQRRIRKDWLDTMQASRTEHSAYGLASSLRQFGQGSCPNLWPALEKLKMPVLLLSGAEDLKYTQIARKMAGILENCRHETIPQSGHMPHLEAAEACAHLLGSFLKQVRAATTRYQAN